MRSENGQLYLVTYNLESKVISKHQINLQLNTEDFSEFKTSSMVESSTLEMNNKQAAMMINIENSCQPVAEVNIPKDQVLSGN